MAKQIMIIKTRTPEGIWKIKILHPSLGTITSESPTKPKRPMIERLILEAENKKR